MANVEDIGIPGIGTGILMPAVQNKWRLNVNLQNTPFLDEVLEILALQVLSFKFDYHNQVMEMVIEQNLNDTKLHTFVKQLSKLSKTNDYEKVKFVVEGLDGTDKVTYRFLFSGCKLLEHEFVLDYACGQACRHWLKMSFKQTRDLT
jgi:hypothetical protein